MSTPWTILHGGALGDLALTVQLALRLPGVVDGAGLELISRTDPGDLSACRPPIRRRSSEGLGLHWLFTTDDGPAPQRLREWVTGRRVLSALGGPHTLAHQRLLELGPAAAYGVDPRPRPQVARHITEQWLTQLEAQGLLVPKCVHQRPWARGVGVPQSLREHGRGLLEASADTSVVLIHPGSGGAGKCWPLPGFVDVARTLAGTLGRQVSLRFLLGPVEVESWPAQAVADLAREFAVLRDLDAGRLAPVLAAADVFLGNDAGPGHLAALLGTAAVTLFGPTAPGIWRPLGHNVQVLAGAVAAGAHWGITPAHVVDTVRQALLQAGRTCNYA